MIFPGRATSLALRRNSAPARGIWWPCTRRKFRPILSADVHKLREPNVHEVLNSIDAIGGAAHIGVIFSTQKFVDTNPKLAKAFVAAYDEAIALMKNDYRAAAETYLAVTKEKITAGELVPLFTQPGAVYQAAPVRTMVYATFMWKAGFVKTEPKSWKDYFFPLLHDRNGS